MRVRAANRHQDERHLKDGPFEATAILKISVEDADEPPIFTSEEYIMQIFEDDMNNPFVGVVSAKDPDKANSPIRYTLEHKELELWFRNCA